MSELLVEMLRHNTWANTKLVEFCRDLPTEKREGDTSITGTYGNIRDTLLHGVQAQEGYLRSYGRPDAPPPAPEGFPNWDTLLERMRRSSQGFEAFAAEARDGDTWEGDFGAQLWRTPPSVVLTHIVTHATEHRIHVATAITQMGVEPPNLDAWQFGGQRGQVSAVDKKTT